MKRNNMRGQAFVVYKRRDEAELALKTLQGFTIFDKSLVIAFANKQSYAYIIDQGKFVYKNYREKYNLKKAEVLNTIASGEITKNENLQKDNKMPKNEEDLSSYKNILLVENLPENLNEDLFRFLFKQFPGLKHTKLIKEKNIGFAEFLSHAQANIALKATNSFMIRENVILKVSYANKKSEKEE